MIVVLETIPKKEDATPRQQKFNFELAEKVLRKSKNWKIAEGQDYIFKDKSLVKKAPKKKKESD